MDVFRAALAAVPVVPDKVAVVKTEVEAVAKTMQVAITAALQRGVDLESLQGKTQALNVASGVFLKKGEQLRKNMQCRNWKLYLLCALAIAVVGGMISALVAGAKNQS